MISSIMIASHQGDLLIRRDYVEPIPNQKRLISLWLEDAVIPRGMRDRPPLWTHDREHYFVSMPKNETVFAAMITDKEKNVGMVIQILNVLADVVYYFAGDTSVNAVRRAIPTILCILDEILDLGMPQITDVEALKSVILPSGNNGQHLSQGQLREITTQVTGAVSWRAENIKYRRNEVYIDVLESVHALFSTTGALLRAEVSGQVVVKALLSGLPECRFAINDRLTMGESTASAGVILDDVRFHQCVRQPKKSVATLKGISFIPPDGVFQLMMYRKADNVFLPFKITPLMQMSGHRLEISLRLRSSFSRNLHAADVAVHFPLPPGTANINVASCQTGKVRLDAEKKAVTWSLGKVAGETEHTAVVEIDVMVNATRDMPAPGVNSTTALLGRGHPPIRVEFELPMFTASGLKVKFMKVQERSSYKAVKWIRYLTRAGMYNRRI